MKLSVAHNFDPALVPHLAAIGKTYEVFGKLDRDIIGGGRSTYTLRHISKSRIALAVQQAHDHGITFNYLVNGASLNGQEQTRSGQKRIRNLLDWVAACGVDAVTVASPFLAQIVTKMYPKLGIRASAFAMIDTPAKARQWEDLGANTLCVSAITCNRDFERLRAIRDAVSCELQLIVNSSCLSHCVWEPTHMQLLTQSSRKHDTSHGFCLDYCVLNCSHRRLKDPVNFVRSVWIRPEDLSFYEKLGIDCFKVLERSCPTDLLVKRVKAYRDQSFDGNLYELVAPMASIRKELGATFFSQARMILSMLRPGKIKISSLLRIQDYMNEIIPHQFDRNEAPVYIDNMALDGFIQQLAQRRCATEDCSHCGICERFAAKAVHIKQDYRERVLHKAETLQGQTSDGSLW